MATRNRSAVPVTVLVLVAVALLIPIYHLPVWWVSLEAPNYPPEAFPDGVRILFHLNGVFNGCQLIEKDEIQVDEAVDCVHEMDTINHYVGMYPIAAGGPIELSFSLFIVTLLGVLLIGFVVEKAALRLAVMGVGLVVVCGWMSMSWHSPGGLRYHSERYLEGRSLALGGGAEEDESEALSPGEALIARLKASLEEGGEADSGAGDPEAVPAEGKEAHIAQLRAAYVADQGPGGRNTWRGSGQQLLAWHYGKTLGRYFNDPEQIGPMVQNMARAARFTFWGTILIGAFLVVASYRTNGIFHWLLVLVPITLPILFVVALAAWLWWYGHNMSDMGAFTLKPFMPTVFGQGKVAQFTTNSYPHVGFYLMLAFSALLLAAAFIRQRALQSDDPA